MDHIEITVPVTDSLEITQKKLTEQGFKLIENYQMKDIR